MVSAAGGGASSMALDMTKPGKFQIAITAVNDKGIDAVKEKYILLVENDEFVPEEQPITTTWDTSALTLAEGDAYAFSGKINSLEPLDKLHIMVFRADNTSVGIDYYREVEIGGTTFDLSTVPSITAGTLLKGLQVTNNQSELSLGNGTYLIRMWIADTAGNRLDLSKLITVTDVSDAPVVEMLPITEITASTAKLQAKVVDVKGGIIVDFGFNLYDTETGGERLAQYSASHPEKKYRIAQYDPTTGIITVDVPECEPNKTYYAEGFAIYYQGENPVTGFTDGRTEFTIYPADIAITSPAANTAFPDGGEVTVSGKIVEHLYGMTYTEPVIRIYDYLMQEITSVTASMVEDMTFTAVIDLTGYYAGGYYITAESVCGEVVMRSAPVKLLIPGKLAVELLPLDDTKIHAKEVYLTAQVPDDEGKKIENYGFNLYREDGSFYVQYSAWHDDPDCQDVKYNAKTGLLSGTVKVEPGTTYTYVPFVVYYENGAAVECFAEESGTVTSKTVDIRIDHPTTLQYIGDSGRLTVVGTVTDYGAAEIGNPQIFVYLGDTLIKSVDPADIVFNRTNGTFNTQNLEFSDCAYGNYTIQAYITAEKGASYSNSFKVNYVAPVTQVELSMASCNGDYELSEQVLNFEKYHSPVLVTNLGKDVERVKKIQWVADDTTLRLTPWAEKDTAFYNERPSKCQLDCNKAGQYRLEVIITNYDDSQVKKVLEVNVVEFFSVLVVDYITCQPVTDATVTINEITRKTNEDGYAIFNMAVADNMNVIITKAGYRMIDTSRALYGNTINTFYLFDNDQDVFNVYIGESGGDKQDALTAEYSIDVTGNLTYDIEVITGGDADITKVALVQNNTVIAESSNGVFEGDNAIPAETFKANSGAVSVVVYYSGVPSKSTKTQITATKPFYVKDTPASISLGQSMKITLPGEIPVIGGTSVGVDFSFIPVNVVLSEGGNVKLTVGYKKNSAMLNPEKYQENWDSYNEYKDAFSDLANSGNIQKFKNIVQKSFDKADEKTSAGVMSSLFNKKNFSSDLLGYLEYTSATGTLSGKIVWIGTYKASAQKQFAIAGVPMVFGIAFDVSVHPTIGFELTGLDELFESNPQISIKPTAVISIPMNFKLSLGVGLAYIASASVYGNGKFQTDIHPEKVAVSVTVSGGVEFKALCYTKTVPLVSIPWTKEIPYYEDYMLQNASDSTTTYSMHPSVLYSSDGFTVADRSYVDNTSDWYTEQNKISDRTIAAYTLYSAADTASEPETETSYTTMMSGIYPDTQMQVTETDFGALMVWLSDDTTRSAVNRTNLVYSVYTAATDTWSIPQAVDNNGTVDAYPYLYSDENNIVLAWTDLSEVMTEAAGLEDCFAKAEIKTAVFNPKTMSFVDVTRITDNSTADVSPKVFADAEGNLKLLWASVDSSNVLALIGTNTLYCADIDGMNKESLLSVELPVVSYTGGILNGASAIVYATDADADISTNADRTVYAMNMQSGAVSEIYTGIADNVKLHEGMLFWHTADSVCAADTVGEVLVLPIMAENYDLFTYDDLIYITVMDKELKQLLAYRYDSKNNVCSDAIIWLYDVSMNYADVCNTKNGIVTVFTHQVSETSEASICYSVVKESCDLRLNNVYFDESTLSIGQMFPLELNITNAGTRDVEEILLTFRDNNGYEFTKSAEIDLPAGSTRDITVTVGLPETFEASPAEFTVCIAVPESEDVTSSDNEETILLGYTNMGIECEMHNTSQTSALVSVIVTNKSYFGGDAVLNVRKDTSDGEILYSETITDLQKGDVLTYSFPITAELLNTNEQYTNVYVELVADTEEYMTADNIRLVVFEAETAPVLGDINCDGTVNNEDLKILQEYFAGWKTQEGMLLSVETADLDEDSRITRRDAMILARHLAGWDGYDLPYIAVD